MLLTIKSEMKVINKDGLPDIVMTTTIIDTEKLNDVEKIAIVNELISATENHMKRNDSKEDPVPRARMNVALNLALKANVARAVERRNKAKK